MRFLTNGDEIAKLRSAKLSLKSPCGACCLVVETPMVYSS